MCEDVISSEALDVALSSEIEMDDVYCLEDLLEASKKNSSVKVANRILKENRIIYSAQDFYRYKGGLYQVLDENRVKKMVKDILKLPTIHRSHLLYMRIMQ